MFDWRLLGNTDLTLYFGIGDITDKNQAEFIVKALSRSDMFDKGNLISFSIVYELEDSEQEVSFRKEVNKIHKQLSAKRRKYFTPNVVNEKIKDRTKFLDNFCTRLKVELAKASTFQCPDSLQ